MNVHAYAGENVTRYQQIHHKKGILILEVHLFDLIDTNSAETYKIWILD